MNHKAIVISQLGQQAAKLRAELAQIETAIMALGGKVAAGVAGVPAAFPKRTRRRGVAGVTATGSVTVRAPRVRAKANGADSPALVERLKSISSDPGLTPIQKAQASRKARAAAKRGETVPVKAEGAILSEAAAAEA